MRRILLLAAVIASGAAHADFIPVVSSGQNLASVTINNGTLPYSENRNANGPLGALIVDAQYTPFQIQSGLNTAVASLVNSNGARFGSGKLTGLPTITMRPDPSGVIFVTLSGLSYKFNSSYSGTKLGVINFSCTNTTSYNNISITAQMGSVNGAIASNTVGINGTLSTSTDCDSNLTWMLPVIGNLLVNKAQGTIDAGITNAIQNGLSSTTQKFLFLRDQNWLVGLNRLIPADKVVAYPGGSFPIGQYLIDNLTYVINNSQITLKLGPGADLSPVVGASNEPPRELSGDAITLTVSSPGVTFTANLREQVNVVWKWKCSVANPALNCADPR